MKNEDIIKKFSTFTDNVTGNVSRMQNIVFIC